MTTDTAGGYWTYALELAYGLSGRGVQVHLAITRGPLHSSQREQADRIPYLTVYQNDQVSEPWDLPWQDVTGVGRWLLSLESELHPEIVHVNDLAHAALPWSAPVLVVGHACVYSWFSAVSGSKPPVEWESYRRGVVRGLRSADGVTAGTYAMLGSLRDNYGGFASLGRICNGRSGQNFEAADKEPFVLTSGRLWDESKNVAALEHVAPRLAWPVYQAGDDKPTNTGTHAGGLRSLGQLTADEMAGWMSRAAIFAAPARYEPFGFSALEAALSGCTLVLGDIPSLRELWGDAAIYVRPDDTGALLAALRELIDDDILRHVTAGRAMSRAREYSSQRMTDGYLHAYAHLTRGSNRSITKARSDSKAGIEAG